MDRRDFLRFAGGMALAGASCAYAFKVLIPSTAGWAGEGFSPPEKRYGMVIDLTKCREREGCTACIEACHTENNVARFEDEPQYDVHWLRKVTAEATQDAPEKEVLLLCNHCDEPPCAQVCPVQATYKRHDGIVIVDHHRCVGCRYCMIACPYNARQFNFRDNERWTNEEHPKRSHGVAEACTLCAHRLDRGRPPACVEACPMGAIRVGDLMDTEKGVGKTVATESVKRLKEDLGTKPKVYYLGL